MKFPHPVNSRLLGALFFSIAFAVVQVTIPNIAFSAPHSNSAKNEQETAKTLYAELTTLLKEYYPRAKVTIDGNTMHFEYKCHGQIGTQSHVAELAPGIDGVLGDIEVKQGSYKGKDSLPKRVNLITYEAILLAPYSQIQDSHIMARLAFDPNAAPEFLEQFKELVNKAAIRADATAKAPPNLESAKVETAKAEAKLEPKVETAKDEAPKTEGNNVASAIPASTVVKSEKPPEKAAEAPKTEVKTEAKTETKPETKSDPHPSEALHDHDKTTDPWARNQVVLMFYKKRAAEQGTIIKAKPTDPVAYSERSDANLHLNNPKQALEDADKSISLCGKSHRILRYAYCNRGEARIQMKQYKEALPDLEKAIEMEKENGEAIYFRGMVKEKTGDLEGAIKDYELARSYGFAPYGVSVDYQPYMEDLQRRIKKAWFPPKGNESRKLKTYFEVNRDGSLKSSKVEQTSGVPAADQAALAAIKNASPFPRLPYGSKSSVKIEFSFDYNVWGKGSSIVSDVSSAPSMVSMEDEAKQKLASAERAKDEPAQVVALLSLGDLMRTQGNHQSAEEYYTRALSLVSEKADRKFEHAKVMSRFAILHSSRGKTQEADTHFKEAFRLAKEAGKNQLDPDVTEMLTEYAKFLYKSSRFAEANKIYTMLKQ